MSHKGVETIIGKLVTDEAFRHRFFADSAATLEELRRRGCEVTAVEADALREIDPAALRRFASGIDGRLQKLALRSEVGEGQRS